MKADAEQRIKAADDIRSEAAKVLADASAERDKVVALKKKAEKEQERMIAEGKAKAQEIQENALAEAQTRSAKCDDRRSGR